MSAQALPSHRAQFRVVILNGPDKGTSYQLLSDEVSIGRGHDNDIVVNDSRCSRKHAVLTLTDEGVEISDLSNKNQITFNEQKRERALLTNGSVFTLGITQFRLETTESALPKPVPISPEATRVMPFPTIPQPIPTRPPRGPKRNMTFYYLIVGIALGLGWLLWPSHKPPAENTPVQSDDQIESTIQDFRSKEEILRKQINDSPQYKEAQALYLQGFRDYRKGQFELAIEEFRAALSIYPDHQLANRYLKLARRRLDEEIQQSIIEGRQFRERNMFRRCVASFDIAMSFLKDPNNLTYREAKEMRDECALHLEGDN